MAASRPQLAALDIADPPERWEALGFAVDDRGWTAVGGVQLRLGARGHGITSWSLRGLAAGVTDLDGLPTEPARASAPAPERGPVGGLHPNGALAIDHVVVLTPRFDRTAAVLERAGMPLRRIRQAGPARQGFRRLGPAILELVEAPEAPAGPARFFGLVVIVPELEAPLAPLALHLGAVRPAVQPGRRIATLGRGAGLSVAVAFMDPEPGMSETAAGTERPTGAG